MSSKQSLTACIAALMIPIRQIPARSSRFPARAVAVSSYQKAVSILIRLAIVAGGLVISLSPYAAAQEPPSASDAAISSVETAPRPDAAYDPTPDSIMGFESPNFWSTKINGTLPDSSIKSTTVRTQGNAAYSVINPPTAVTVTSIAVGSSAKSLTGIGNNGALLQVDVQVQVGSASAAANLEQIDADATETTTATNATSIQAFVTSKSRGLNRVSLGTVSFQKLRTGIYNTISFSIPDSVSSALHGSKFTDLIFEFDMKAAETIEGAYLFDNVRVHSVEMVQSPKGIAPPSGYGGLLSLVVNGSKPFSRTFSLVPAQIPNAFQLTKGVAGKTTVQLQYGLDSKPQLTCTYNPASSTSTNQAYAIQSCTGGYRAGDLVSANWVSLAILKGVASQELHAELVLSPLGNVSGAGLIPPMPTYWGEADTCMPAPVHGKVVTTSASCATQRSKANQILTDYFEAVKSAHPTDNWVVAPVTESAVRSGNAAPLKSTSLEPLDSSSNVPFDTGGDLNPGGSFDAYWQLSGNLDPTAVAGTDENLTHFDAAFTAHGVLFGDDIDVVDAKITADTDSGETTPTYKAATSSGTLGFYVFGEEIPSGGLTFTPSTGFSVDPSWTQEYDLPPIQIWIFDITLGALVDADLSVSGSAALSGADLSVVPTASLGGHISGGINLGIADGNVDTKINLISLSTPVEAQAKWVLNNSPAVCAATINGSLKGDLKVGSGGGEVDLDATFGICPFCYTDSWTLYKWGSLASTSYNLFNDALAYQAFGLPASLCPLATTVSIVSPSAGASLSSGIPTQLTGSATPNDSSVTQYSSTYKWTFTPGANASTVQVVSGATSATPVVKFGAPKSGTTSTWTVNLTATTTVHSQGGTVITKTASAAPLTITVSSAQPGDYITQVLTQNNGPATPDSYGDENVGNAPGAITVNGTVVGGTGNYNTTFSVVACNDETPYCTDPGPAPFPTITTSGANTTSPSAVWTGFSGGYFLFNMTTTSNGVTIGNVTVTIVGSEII